jgi:hypothetical protein
MGAKALENYKTLQNTITQLNDELQVLKNAYNCITELYNQEKFELLKLVERNQLAWNHSLDKSYNLLPEVYQANKYVLEKVGENDVKKKC